jgi:hypothetical protein
MPAKSEKQKNFFEMIAKGKKSEDRVGPSKEVAKKFLGHKKGKDDKKG